MAEANFLSLMRGAYVQNFPPQIELIGEGEPSDFLHVVLSGSVDLFSTWNGRETSLATVRPVSTFILAATIKNAPYLMSARTLEKSRIVLIPSQDVRAIFDDGRQFCPGDRDGAGAVLPLGHQGTEGPEAANLAGTAGELSFAPAEARRWRPPWSIWISKSAAWLPYLGMTPENLSRAFKGLQPYGVTVEGTRIADWRSGRSGEVRQDPTPGSTTIRPEGHGKGLTPKSNGCAAISSR